MIQPYTPFDEINQFFGRLGLGTGGMAAANEGGRMAVGVATEDDNFVVTADLPATTVRISTSQSTIEA